MIRILGALALCAATVLCASGPASAAGPPAKNNAPAEAADPNRPAFTMARRLGRGINILGYDGIWDGGTDAPFRQRQFRQIREAGFSHVRINLHAFRHMDASGRLDPAILKHLDWVVAQSRAAGLIPVVDEHDFSDCQAEPAACAERLKSFWREMSVHYAGREPDLVFEFLNEPGGKLDAEAWNRLLADLLLIVRASNSERTVIVAAINSEDPREIWKLRLPARDINLIVTVHYYAPFRFTHQGAPWAPEVTGLRDIDWGSPADRDRLRSDLAEIASWQTYHRRPVYLGEFGVYEAAGLPRRARWLDAVAREAESHGWPWAAWQFDHDFALFDQTRDRWIAPLLEALVPAKLAPAARRTGTR